MDCPAEELLSLQEFVSLASEAGVALPAHID